MVIYSSLYLHKVEMIKAFLAENEIEGIVINRQDSFYKTIGEITLYVNRDHVLRAKQIINKISSE